MLLSALRCNCRVHCDLRHGSLRLLCLGGLRNPHRANLTLVGVVVSHELSFHFYFSIFLALMVGIGKLRLASWVIKRRTNKKNAQGWFYLFCYHKDHLVDLIIFQGAQYECQGLESTVFCPDTYQQTYCCATFTCCCVRQKKPSLNYRF